MKGTPLFMAPEMLLKRKCGRRVDIWSLGCAVIEMVTTRPPWADAFKHPVEIIAHFNENPGPPPLPADLSPGLRRFLLSCFTWDPEMRPSASELCSHGYLQSRSLPPLDGADGISMPDDVPLEEMDRVSAVTRMRRCSSATLDLLAVQARQAALGVGISGGALAGFGTAPSGTFRPPSPRYGPGGAATQKRTPTRRRHMPPPENVTQIVAAGSGGGGVGSQQTNRSSSNSGNNSNNARIHQQYAPCQGSNLLPEGGEGDGDQNRSRRNSMPLSKSPSLSPDKSREPVGERPKTLGHRPGRGSGFSSSGLYADDDVRTGLGRPGRGSGGGSCEDEGRVSGPIPPRLRGPGCDRANSGESGGSGSASSRSKNGKGESHAANAAESGVGGPAFLSPSSMSTSPSSSYASSFCNIPSNANGVRNTNVPTPLSTPREHDGLVGVTLVGSGGSGVAEGSVTTDSPPPIVTPLEHPSNSSGRSHKDGEPSWSTGVAQGPASAMALLQRRGGRGGDS